MESCAICQLHADPAARQRYEIRRSELWVLRHHPDPAPLPGWLLLDSLRHCSGPVDFSEAEASDWGRAVRVASHLVKQITGCNRVYAIAFGEGAQHLHLHLIPRFVSQLETKAWSVADLYRQVESRKIESAKETEVFSFIEQARHLTKKWSFRS